ncbi:glycosyltransferase [Geminocystis sp. GBBB08]|uniref:glycosyltransferase n=1 Tax=Geminocystis sp. GBBB08 TaxID=2604140 RepID=UPI0027E34957|nr:glycosyltransferase [Geminocystis sp. GBBB08]MBL1210471.1 glycosyltransferase [Geminocystis sp. GBBB08]
MNNQPLVSIGIFVYNEAKFIAQTIESWLNQDYQNIEIVISDNASEDKTFELCQQYAEKDHRIVLNRNSQNIGAAFNAKKVVEMSTGKYFIWSSGHDDRDTKLLSSCVKVLESNQNVVLAYPQANWINEKGESFDSIGGCIETRGLDPLSRLNMILWGLAYASPVYGLFRADALQKVSLGKSLIAPDVLLLSELSILGEFAYVPLPLLQMRRMPDYGSWDSYVGKIFNQSLSQLSVPEIFGEMLKEFVTNITKHINDPKTKQTASYLIVQGLMVKYGGILVTLLREKNSNLSDKEQVILQNIQNISTFLQKNNDFLSTNLINFSDYPQSKQPVNISEPKSPIILIDGVFFQLNQTGIARVWKSLLEQWANSDFSNHILVLDRTNTAPKIPGIRYRTIPPYNPNNLESDRFLLQQICDEEKADLFISTYYTIPKTTKSVMMIYDLIPEVMGWETDHIYWKGKHDAINYASSFISISENTAQDLQKFFPETINKGITVALLAADQDFGLVSESAIFAFRHKYNIQKPYYLLVGNEGFQGYKNQILFFQAFAQLPTKSGFDIIWTGNKGYFPEQYRQYIQGCSIYSLQLSDQELKIAYNGAIALVFPSKYEGFGFPVLEAMTCGCPVITSPNSSIPEVGGDAVFYVNSDDVQGMMEALCEIQKPRVRDLLRNKGFQQAQQFSGAKTAETCQNLLLENAQSINNSFNINFQTLNLIIFPDWQQDEEELSLTLTEVLSTIASHPQAEEITLIIDTTNAENEEDVKLLVSAVTMNLMLEEAIELSEATQIAFIGNLTSQQWEKLLILIQYRIRLDIEYLPMYIEKIAFCNIQDISNLSVTSLENDLLDINFQTLNLIIFPDWQQDEEELSLTLAEVLKGIANHPQGSEITLIIDITNAENEEDAS